MWHVYASTLLPLFNNLWLGQGTGNSNFFYAATLVFGVANGAALLDSTWAGLTLPYGQPKEGYTLLQI
jgi:GPI-anchor transamidase subunit U